MIKKELGLKTNFEFNITRKYGKYYFGRYFHLYVLKPTNYKGISKLGVVTSAKLDKRAVVRNQVKRMFKQAFKEYLNEITDQSLWLVVHPKFIAKEKTYEEISADVAKTLQKVSIS